MKEVVEQANATAAKALEVAKEKIDKAEKAKEITEAKEVKRREEEVGVTVAKEAA